MRRSEQADSLIATTNRNYRSLQTATPHTITMTTETPDPLRRTKTWLRSALAATVLLVPLAACKSTLTVRSTRSEFVASVVGYQLRASLDRPATLESVDDHALITFGRHQLRVEKGRVVLDDNETAAFPPTAERIDIVITRGTLRMSADGAEMWKKPMPEE